MTQNVTHNDDTLCASASCDVGIKIKALRELAGISQRELARRSGLTNSSVSQIEQNHVSPSVQSLERLLMALQVSLSDFFLFSMPSDAVQPSMVSHRYICVEPRSTSPLFRVASATTGVVVEGEVSLCSIEGEQGFAPGDVIHLLANHIYKLSNEHSVVASVFVPLPS